MKQFNKQTHKYKPILYSESQHDKDYNKWIKIISCLKNKNYTYSLSNNLSNENLIINKYNQLKN